MLRWLQFVVAVLVLAFAVHGQGTDPRKVAELNQKAVEALTAKRYDDGIELLKQVLELVPEQKGTAYNLACAHALKADVDASYQWMEKACAWGWGTGTGALAADLRTKLTEVDLCKTDVDLENLRKDPRWAGLLVKIEANFTRHAARIQKGREYSLAPAVYVPESIKALEKKPVLLVVHDEGSTKDQVVAGVWKEIADALGFALVVPSGRIPIGDEPKDQGMAWFEFEGDYLGNVKGAEEVETGVHGALKFFEKTDKIDRAKLVLVGEGQTGTLVAFGAGVSSPGLYKMVLGLDGAFEPARVQAKGANAAKLGQRARLLLAEDVFGDDPKLNEQARARLTKLLGDAGLGTATSYAKKADDPKARVALVVEAVKGLLAAAPAPAAPAPK